MFGISSPPPPQLTNTVAFGAAVACLAVGILMLIWGRHLGRAFLCAAGMAAGLALGGPIARMVGWNLVVVRLVATVVAGLVALAMARLLWALLAGALFGILAELIVLAYDIHQIAPEKQPVFQPADGTLTGWAMELGRFLLAGLAGLWDWNLRMVLATIGLAAVVPVVIALVRDRVGRIFITSLIGAAGPVAGAIIALGQIRPSLWHSALACWYVALGLVGLGMLVGITVQYRSAICQDRSAKEREAEPPEEQDDDERTRKADRKKKKR